MMRLDLKDSGLTPRSKLNKHMTKAIGQVIRSAREAKGLSQNDVASKLGVDRSMVSNWETGTFRADPEKIFLMSQLFATDLWFQIGEVIMGDIHKYTNTSE